MRRSTLSVIKKKIIKKIENRNIPALNKCRVSSLLLLLPLPSPFLRVGWCWYVVVMVVAASVALVVFVVVVDGVELIVITKIR
jgi:hypothetical protein